MRTLAERALRSRRQVLIDRASRRALTVVERRELDGSGPALNALLELETPTGGEPLAAL
jgi:hypothetical protein